jgi:biofilm protein TabA
MIIDTLASAQKYYGLHKNFKIAFDYLRSTDLNTVEAGIYDIADGVKVIAAEGEGKKAEVALETFECHNQNIDIQLCISGTETMGWKSRTDCTQPKGEYSDEKDVLFFADAPDMYFNLKGGQFVIFYPEDVHAPMIGEGLIKKMVVKVRID